MFNCGVFHENITFIRLYIYMHTQSHFQLSFLVASTIVFHANNFCFM